MRCRAHRAIEAGPTSVGEVFRALALVPSPPLLVPELTGPGVADAEPVRSAALEAAAALGAISDRWIAVGVGRGARRISSESVGTFAGFGADVSVSLSPGARDLDVAMPLPALVAGWLRGVSAPEASVDVVLVGRGSTPDEARGVGQDLRASMTGDWGVLVVGDGATTLTAKAPGSFDERAEGVQNSIDDALAAADVDALAALDADLCRAVGVEGLAAWQVLSGLVGNDRVAARTLYRGAPFGVGYYVGLWEPVQ